MGDESVILEGVGGETSAEALFSTVHGAGRVMSRTQAAGKVRRRTVYACTAGQSTRPGFTCSSTQTFETPASG